jgi:hypothetical protein
VYAASQQVAWFVLVVRLTQTCVLVTLILFNNGPESNDAGTSAKPRRNCKVLSLSEKIKALEVIRKEENHTLTLLRGAVLFLLITYCS